MQGGGVATGGEGDEMPVGEGESPGFGRVVAGRAFALEDCGFQGRQGKGGEDFDQVNTARGRSGLWRVLYRIEPLEELPDGRIGAKHPDLALDRPPAPGLASIGGLNAAAEARYERGRDPIDGPTARLIGHDSGLVNGNEHVVVR